jgi:NADPH:quinone reductase-like Zn-dependent oxidoreductase
MMRAARIHRFGAPDVIVVEEVPCPTPSAGEVLVRVAAAGVGPWDALIREGKSKVSPPPPLTLGSDLSGVVEAVGPGVSQFKLGDEIYGVTNPQFCEAQAEYAIASAGMVALKPKGVTFLEAASAPVIAVTAWQMLFEYAKSQAGHTVMILGAAGNVGAYAVQLAVNAGIRVVAIVRSKDVEFARSLGAKDVWDYGSRDFEDPGYAVDAIIDTVGGDTGNHKAGNHAFRRFRNTYLRNRTECPEGLYKYLMGHAGESMSDLYDKIKEDVPFRKKWAEQCGFGFELPSVVPNVPKKAAKRKRPRPRK